MSTSTHDAPCLSLSFVSIVHKLRDSLSVAFTVYHGIKLSHLSSVREAIENGKELDPSVPLLPLFSPLPLFSSPPDPAETALGHVHMGSPHIYPDHFARVVEIAIAIARCAVVNFRG